MASWERERNAQKIGEKHTHLWPADRRNPILTSVACLHSGNNFKLATYAAGCSSVATISELTVTSDLSNGLTIIDRFYNLICRYSPKIALSRSTKNSNIFLILLTFFDNVVDSIYMSLYKT
ncbi:hypothetical protein EV681_3262 [Advenella incenata]|uniref:Uncharacterized protein n=1 Tax=Advenella incenata TaxID=267800 RepID=A0A4Q7VFJ4_9BURK|nr:hypothetical protein EV681_3262 [Advenella incenata]